MHLLKMYPQAVRIYGVTVMEAFVGNKELSGIMKQEMLNVLRDEGGDNGDVERRIRQFGEEEEEAPVNRSMMKQIKRQYQEK